jgi:hypothetical protein
MSQCRSDAIITRADSFSEWLFMVAVRAVFAGLPKVTKWCEREQKKQETRNKKGKNRVCGNCKKGAVRNVALYRLCHPLRDD